MSLRPNPLSPGRASPFRRPESPTTGTASYQSTRPATPSRLNSSSLPNADGSWSPTLSSPSTMTARANLRPVASREMSPTKANGSGNGNHHMDSGSTTPTRAQTQTQTATVLSPSPLPSSSFNTEALSKLPAAQVRELREAYAILDRDGSGGVTRADVADMLGQLGLENDERAVAGYFSSSSSSSAVTMPAFLSGIASSLARMSPPAELLAALAAFDDDDSGQIDTAELVDALVGGGSGADGAHYPPLNRQDVEAVMGEFVGRRAFNKYSAGTGGRGGLGGGGGEVFRYREWVAGLGPVATGGGGAAQGEKVQAA